MGKAKRIRPDRIGEKLLLIRNYFDCSLSEMAKKLSNNKFNVRRTAISAYELQNSEPPLHLVLRYAHLAGINVEYLIDDELDLPHQFPCKTKSKSLKTVKEK